MLLGPPSCAFTLAVSAAVAQVGDGISALNHRILVDAVGEANARTKVQFVNGYLVVAGTARAVAILRWQRRAGCRPTGFGVVGARNTLLFWVRM